MANKPPIRRVQQQLLDGNAGYYRANRRTPVKRTIRKTNGGGNRPKGKGNYMWPR